MGKTTGDEPGAVGISRQGHAASAGSEARCLRHDAAASREGCVQPGAVGSDEVRKTIDAVSGATWGTRNRIMAGLFQRDLRTRGDDMPAFAPPGEDILR